MSVSPLSMPTRRDYGAARIDAALAGESYAGLVLGIRIRLGVLAAVAVFLAWELPLDRLFLFLPMIAVMAGLALWQLAARKPGCDTQLKAAAFAFAESAILVGTLVWPTGLTPPMRLGFDGVLFLGLFIALSSLGLSPGLVLWNGFTAVVCWWTAWAWVILQPGVHFGMPGPEVLAGGDDALVAFLSSPWQVSPATPARQTLGLAMLTLTLGGAAWRARRMVRRHAETERARANLSRYFSPTVVESLAGMDDPFREARTIDAVILFADLVGFTAATAALPPDRVIVLVRAVQRRLAQAVFAENGTVDKFLGDGLMASFGTPVPAPGDAARALAAATRMMTAIDTLNAEREPDAPPIQLSVGLHFGPVTLGNIGDETRMEFTVIGQTVNVASRIEKLTRQHEAAIAASGAFIAQLGAEAPAEADRFTAIGPVAIRGLAQPLPLYRLGQPADTTAPREAGATVPR